MSHKTAADLALQERPTPSVERLVSLVSALAEDLDQGLWGPGPLEQSLAARLMVACAGDGCFTPDRVRETLLAGSITLTYAGDGRLARLFAQLIEVTAHPASDADTALDEARRLVERVADDRSVADVKR
ncbi:hypothetical protein SAMN05446589_9567 [Streptomyces sp. OV198]|jgi:hypothetical protein|uniref:hypothetical protein n=1 Tax=Streptomyces sp. OV198 TaxID=1882787 RepID=UPI000BCB31CD|nr:hypothetical protein [Streptomyces sp. OV198]SOF02420.1 hypothetical protein SAMN05446589_9567 [Streptomyces sp. OV198]